MAWILTFFWWAGVLHIFIFTGGGAAAHPKNFSFFSSTRQTAVAKVAALCYCNGLSPFAFVAQKAAPRHPPPSKFPPVVGTLKAARGSLVEFDSAFYLFEVSQFRFDEPRVESYCQLASRQRQLYLFCDLQKVMWNYVGSLDPFVAPHRRWTNPDTGRNLQSV